MTSTALPGPRPADDAAVSATVAADLAAARAGVRVAVLETLAGVEAAAALFSRIWRTDPARPPLSVEVMRAFEHAGGYVAGAWSGPTLVGASAGFLGLDGTAPVLHSHISGVSTPGRGIGVALKLHQRAWALKRGIGAITWTFDPLVRRNAAFNLSRLGAVGVEHLVDFYGAMTDGVNSGERSDRLFTRWDLRTPHRPLDGADGVLVLGEREGLPQPHHPDRSGPWLVALPDDVERLRASDPAAASQWRLAVRDALDAAFARGLLARGTTPAGHLVLAR